MTISAWSHPYSLVATTTSYIFKSIFHLFQDAQYFSDSEHQMVSGSWSHHRGSMGNGGIHPGDISRRMRNRTLTGLETMQRMGGGGAAANGVGAMDHLRPGSASGRPITPSFSNDKEPGQTFIDFNPAGMTMMHPSVLFLLQQSFICASFRFHQI